MTAIAVEDRQYRTYILTDSAGQSSIEVVPERGGILTRWRVRGEDLLYLDEARFADPTLSVRGGIPILFPICGNLPDNTYTHGGQPYTLKQHGFARDLPWSAIAHSTDPLSLTLGLDSNDQTRALYPFEFKLAFTYRLSGTTLTLHQRVTNDSSESLPFSVGFHPYFTVQDKAQLQFQIPSSEFVDQRAKTRQAYTGQFDFTQDELDLAFTELSSPVATVVDGGRSQRLGLSFSPEFSTLVFWTVKGKNFYCLEPWTAGRNALNTGDRLLQLDPGTSLETEFILTAEV